LKPWGVSPSALASNPRVHDPYDEVLNAYFQAIKKWNFHHDANAKSTLKIVYTAMHGVGKECATRAFQAFGLKPFYPVKEQIDPHPDFPTVPFPNPEEGKGALALSVKLATAEGANIIIANDPDADRLAAAEKLPKYDYYLCCYSFSFFRPADVIPGFFFFSSS
jgi:phosphomannomutase